MDALNKLYMLGQYTPRRFRTLAEVVLSDVRFKNGIASASHHPPSHRTVGGLPLHTYEVALAAMEMSGTDRRLEHQAWLVSVWHDFGKIHEYEWRDCGVQKLPFAQRIGHIAWSWATFIQAGSGLLDGAELEDMGHAILAHHGRKEFGSPVIPQTKLAMILHTADGMSARGLVQCS